MRLGLQFQGRPEIPAGIRLVLGMLAQAPWAFLAELDAKPGPLLLYRVGEQRGLQDHLPDRQLLHADEMERLTAAWEADRNERVRSVGWKFTVDGTREKMVRLYPRIELEK